LLIQTTKQGKLLVYLMWRCPRWERCDRFEFSWTIDVFSDRTKAYLLHTKRIQADPQVL